MDQKGKDTMKPNNNKNKDNGGDEDDNCEFYITQS